MTNKTNRTFGLPYLKYQLNANTFDSSHLDADLGSQSRTSAIVYSWFRDGSALHGPVGATGATGKQTALYAFGSLSRCFSVLSAWRRSTSDKPVVPR